MNNKLISEKSDTSSDEFHGVSETVVEVNWKRPDTKAHYGTACSGPNPRVLDHYSSLVLDLQCVAHSIQAPLQKKPETQKRRTLP